MQRRRGARAHFFTTVDPPLTVVALLAVPAVAVPADSVVVVVFVMVPSSPADVTVVTVRVTGAVGDAATVDTVVFVAAVHRDEIADGADRR